MKIVQFRQTAQHHPAVKGFIVGKTGIQHQKTIELGIQFITIVENLILSVQHRLPTVNIFQQKIPEQKPVPIDMNAVVNKKFGIQRIDHHPHGVQIYKTGNIRLSDNPMNRQVTGQITAGIGKDIGNIIQYDALTGQDGSEYAFSNPQGIYVLDDGTMYIAESGNHEVVRCDIRGQIQQIFGKPETSLLPEGVEYRPDKVVVDERGRVYVLARGVYQGMIYMEPDGTFIKFFGSRNVVLSAKDQFRKIFRSLLTEEAGATMQAFIPLEYSNIFMDPEGYIYGTVIGEAGQDILTRINPVGINALPYKMNSPANTEYTDVTADEYGIVTMLDRRFGTIRQRADSGILFQLGGVGDQAGLFRRPVSLIQAHDNLYVLDADKNTITELEITEFGRLVHTAIRTYKEGRYEECIEPCQEVIRRSGNYLPAYVILGLVYYQMGDYDTAMYYSKLGEQPATYSDAYKGASLLQIRDAFGGIVIGIVILIIVIVVFKRYRANRKKRKGAAV